MIHQRSGYLKLNEYNNFISQGKRIINKNDEECFVSDHPKLSNPSKYIRAVNHPKKNRLAQKYSISLGHTRRSVHNMTDCPEEAAVMEILDVEVTRNMFLSLSRGDMVVVASPQTEEPCQVSYIYCHNVFTLQIMHGDNLRWFMWLQFLD